MLYAILAYHEEAVVDSWTPDQQARLMDGLMKVHEKLDKSLGPAARLGPTRHASTLRGPGHGVVIDGPFSETKENLLGFYIVDCASQEEAIAAARELRRVNQTAVYEIRPILRYLPGAPIPEMETAGG